MEILQRRQQGFERRKPANVEAPGEVERLERFEFRQRAQVAAELFFRSHETVWLVFIRTLHIPTT